MIDREQVREKVVTFRATPSELRRLDAAAQVAGVTRSRLLREGGERIARRILQELDERDE